MVVVGFHGGFALKSLAGSSTLLPGWRHRGDISCAQHALCQVLDRRCLLADEMRIHRYRNVRISVAQEVRDLGHRPAIGQQQTGERVS